MAFQPDGCQSSFLKTTWIPQTNCTLSFSHGIRVSAEQTLSETEGPSEDV